MNIPKQLKIGSHVFDVVYPFDFTSIGEEDTLGDYMYTTCKIRIAETRGKGRDKEDKVPVPDCRKRAVLLHEGVHASLFMAGRNKDANNEDLVEALAENLLMIFRENPDLVSCLMEDTKTEKVTEKNYIAPKPTLPWPSWDMPSLVPATNTASHAGFISREGAK